MIEIRVGGKFKLGRKIGCGSFGEIYMGLNVQTKEEVAVKLEPTSSKNPQLSYESKLLTMLAGGPGIPKVCWFGVDGSFSVLVMELLGPSLEDLFSFCNRRLTLKTTLMLGDQMLSRIEYVHSKNFIHRDVKPDNFLIGLGKRSSLVHVIDFGLGKKYRDPKTHRHIPYKDGKSLTGTVRYASINSQIGLEQSRRDDLEALCYVMIYFLKGSLPWQNMQATSKSEKYQRILDKKAGTPNAVLCSELPSELANLLGYTKSLRFDEKPDYNYIHGVFKELIALHHIEYDNIYDWTLLNYSTTRLSRVQRLTLPGDEGGARQQDISRQAINMSQVPDLQVLQGRARPEAKEERKEKVTKQRCEVF
jgi:serine/threonine protein kinase